MTRIIHNIEEFVWEKIMPAKPPNIRFKALPTDHIRLASTVKTVRKILRPQWIEGLDGILDCSIAELLQRIKTEFAIVFSRRGTWNDSEVPIVEASSNFCVIRSEPAETSIAT
ncbi:hypothetical protein N7451_005350 [Penicillium sp. IBT 35674x]|nr:hypothetical protein N7451_005350 [Penicillium sp. IBT 35674x]